MSVFVNNNIAPSAGLLLRILLACWCLQDIVVLGEEAFVAAALGSAAATALESGSAGGGSAGGEEESEERRGSADAEDEEDEAWSEGQTGSSSARRSSSVEEKDIERSSGAGGSDVSSMSEEEEDFSALQETRTKPSEKKKAKKKEISLRARLRRAAAKVKAAAAKKLASIKRKAKRALQRKTKQQKKKEKKLKEKKPAGGDKGGGGEAGDAAKSEGGAAEGEGGKKSEGGGAEGGGGKKSEGGDAKEEGTEKPENGGAEGKDEGKPKDGGAEGEAKSEGGDAKGEGGAKSEGGDAKGDGAEKPKGDGAKGEGEEESEGGEVEKEASALEQEKTGSRRTTRREQQMRRREQEAYKREEQQKHKTLMDLQARFYAHLTNGKKMPDPRSDTYARIMSDGHASYSRFLFGDDVTGKDVAEDLTEGDRRASSGGPRGGGGTKGNKGREASGRAAAGAPRGEKDHGDGEDEDVEDPPIPKLDPGNYPGLIKEPWMGIVVPEGEESYLPSDLTGRTPTPGAAAGGAMSAGEGAPALVGKEEGASAGHVVGQKSKAPVSDQDKRNSDTGEEQKQSLLETFLRARAEHLQRRAPLLSGKAVSLLQADDNFLEGVVQKKIRDYRRRKKGASKIPGSEGTGAKIFLKNLSVDKFGELYVNALVEEQENDEDSGRRIGLSPAESSSAGKKIVGGEQEPRPRPPGEKRKDEDHQESKNDPATLPPNTKTVSALEVEMDPTGALRYNSVPGGGFHADLMSAAKDGGLGQRGVSSKATAIPASPAATSPSPAATANPVRSTIEKPPSTNGRSSSLPLVEGGFNTAKKHASDPPSENKKSPAVWSGTTSWSSSSSTSVASNAVEVGTSPPSPSSKSAERMSIQGSGTTNDEQRPKQPPQQTTAKQSSANRPTGEIVSFRLSSTDVQCHSPSSAAFDLRAEWDRPQLLLHRVRPCAYEPGIPMLSVLERRADDFQAERMLRGLLSDFMPRAARDRAGGAALSSWRAMTTPPPGRGDHDHWITTSSVLQPGNHEELRDRTIGIKSLFEPKARDLSFLERLEVLRRGGGRKIPSTAGRTATPVGDLPRPPSSLTQLRGQLTASGLLRFFGFCIGNVPYNAKHATAMQPEERL